MEDEELGCVEREFDIIESMTTIVLIPTQEKDTGIRLPDTFYANQLLVRVWRNENEIQEEYDNRDIEEAATTMFKNGAGKAEIARAIGLMPRVNAVEVKRNLSGNGIVCYKSWP